LKPLLMYEGPGFIVHASYDFHPFDKKGTSNETIALINSSLARSKKPLALVDPFSNNYFDVVPRLQ